MAVAFYILKSVYESCSSSSFLLLWLSSTHIVWIVYRKQRLEFFLRIGLLRRVVLSFGRLLDSQPSLHSFPFPFSVFKWCCLCSMPCSDSTQAYFLVHSNLSHRDTLCQGLWKSFVRILPLISETDNLYCVYILY